MADSLGLVERYAVKDGEFFKFAQRVEALYDATNPYHNYYHAVDVAHATFNFLSWTHSSEWLEQLEQLAVLLAALGHDVAHPGRNNAFMVRTEHEVALKYNDRSPLENMHAATFFDVLRRDECNILKALEADETSSIRGLIISAILGTDMIHHFNQVADMNVFFQAYGEQGAAFDAAAQGAGSLPEFVADPGTRQFWLDMLLHAADISNPAKDFAICRKWSDRIMEEFFAQGDAERGAGLAVSAMMDEATVNVSVMQMNFAEFVVAPLFAGLTAIFPAFEAASRNLVANQRSWAGMRMKELQDEKGGEEEMRKLQKRAAGLDDKLKLKR